MNNAVHVIACGVFRTDLEALRPEFSNDLHIEYLPGGLHVEPDRLREELQASIDRLGDRTGRIVILYGLCGRGVVGIRSRNHTLVLPRVHDCISLFLGGAREYQAQFSHAPGTYYVSAGWYEEQIQPKGRNPGPQSSSRDNHEGQIRFPERYFGSCGSDEWSSRYGNENAEQIRSFLDSWKKNYTRAVYIDTGNEREAEFEAHARGLAHDNGWNFVRLKGNRSLIRRCVTAEAGDGDSDVVIVPAGHELIQDTGSDAVGSAPVGNRDSLEKHGRWTVPAADRPVEQEHPMQGDTAGTPATGGGRRRFGLGIDAGGTYTDAVIYEFETKRVIARSKSPTTKWKYSVGIMNAVRALPGEYRDRIDLVSVSTTLVTNAVVESARRPVGLLLMPNGDTLPPDLEHSPAKVISGRMSISGEILSGIDRDEILAVVNEMRNLFQVEAFAVSGYGGAVNPELEMAVKEVIRNGTGCEVCCGHELSGTLNFSVRASTAVLNAGVMPIMEEFLSEMETSIAQAGIEAPLMVVRGDGSVMSESYAREFPVQTALSGPAASMAGARFLTGLDEALVVDVGGTTSDIGFLEEGRVSVCDDGARIGRWDTHVKAVDMLTVGLGGDSEIVFQRQEWALGPRRIAPVCSLADVVDPIRESSRRAEDWRESTVPLQFLVRTGKEPDFALTSREQAIFDALAAGPMMIHEIGRRIGVGAWRLVQSGRLELSYCVQRYGFTPTDLYHAEGSMGLWDAGVARSYMALVASAAGVLPEDLRELIHGEIDRLLGQRLLEKLMGPRSGDAVNYQDILNHGNARLELKPAILLPVVGLGAPAELVCRRIVEGLGGEMVVPDNADVANAVGAIASEVRVARTAVISATSVGGYRIGGIDGENRHFEKLETAEDQCIAALVSEVTRHARRAGTSANEVQMEVRTDVARTAEGSELLIARHFEAVMQGPPDLIG